MLKIKCIENESGEIYISLNDLKTWLRESIEYVDIPQINYFIDLQIKTLNAGLGGLKKV